MILHDEKAARLYLRYHAESRSTFHRAFNKLEKTLASDAESEIPFPEEESPNEPNPPEEGEFEVETPAPNEPDGEAGILGNMKPAVLGLLLFLLLFSARIANAAGSPNEARAASRGGRDVRNRDVVGGEMCQDKLGSTAPKSLPNPNSFTKRASGMTFARAGKNRLTHDKPLWRGIAVHRGTRFIRPSGTSGKSVCILGWVAEPATHRNCMKMVGRLRLPTLPRAPSI